MQKAFEKIVERLDYLLNHFGEHCEEWGSDKEGDCHRKSCSDCVLNHAIEIVNQVAEEYKSTEHINCSSDTSTSHRNSDLVIDSSHSNEEVCEWKDSQMSKYYQVGCEVPKIILKLDTVRFKYCPYCGKKIKVVE